MKAITVQELKQWREEGKEHQLIDVRESHEIDICCIDGDHIPMGEILEKTHSIRKDVPVVVHCRSGQRSGSVVISLERNYGFDNLYNLTGGILAWADEIDNSLETY